MLHLSSLIYCRVARWPELLQMVALLGSCRAHGTPTPGVYTLSFYRRFVCMQDFMVFKKAGGK